MYHIEEGRTPVVVSGARTGTGKFGGSLSGINCPELGAICAKEAMKRAGITGDMVDEVIFGTHFQAGIGANSARQVALGAGCPVETPAWTVNKNCGTGLKAINITAQQIMLGEGDIYISGGCDTMSRIPYLSIEHRFGSKMGPTVLQDGMLYDGLVDPFMHYHMGITAENVAKKCGITREQMDEFALASHQKAEAAIKAGKFKDDIVPVEIKGRKGTVVFDADETVRFGAKLEDFQKLKPCFLLDGTGTVTAGNASPCNDEGVAVVMMSLEKARERGLQPKCAIRGFASAGVDPSIMGYAPVYAVQKLLQKTGLKKEDIDLWELNEAFAAQALGCIKDLGLDMEKVNVNGGAIALGHPVGATGARLVMTIMAELERRNARYGVVSLCIGGGQGIATLVERI
ncbi:thiolase family protein [Pseudoflavonifractor phocaeensis]|uniref:thiolase family protein n=1 Tax=Pseudoflavonifractor phocaeensis TaxID=1870988 RepID=UPI00195DF4A8|nr:thiolase family protein [Pseudoflavonifractor phocaeensis]MBM6927208.1 thiolase family protein [Pseudoflavonifractor phocaeensis]